MKKITIVLVIISIILICILLPFGLSIPYANANSEDLEYNFESDVLYSNDSGIFPINETFNLRNQTLYTGHYNGTYSFENENVGTNGTDIDFVDTYQKPTGGTLQIISEFNNHKKVLEFYQPNNPAGSYFDHEIGNVQTDKSIEFYIAKPTGDNYEIRFSLHEIELYRILILFESNDIKYDDGAWKDIKLDCINNNSLHHIRIDWDDTTNTFDFYLDGILVGNDLGYKSNSITGIDKIRVALSDLDYTIYFDAFGYSWDSDYWIEPPEPEVRYSIIEPDTDTDCNWKLADTTHHDAVIDDYDETYIWVVSGDENKIEVFDFDNETLLYEYISQIDIYTRGNCLLGTQYRPTIDYYWNGEWQNLNEIVELKNGGDPDWTINTITGLIGCQSDLTNFKIKYIADDDLTGGEATIVKTYTNLTIIEISSYIPRNMIPYAEINTSIKELNAFEFAHYPNGTLLPIGYDDPNTWYDIEIEENDNVNIYPDVFYDRTVKIDHTIVGNIGLERNFSIDKGILNISFSIGYVIWENNQGYFNCNVKSNDNTLIVRLHFILDDTDIKLFFWNGLENIYLYTFSTSQFENYMNNKFFNLYINNFCILTYKYGEFNEIWSFPLIEQKKGLSHLEFIGNVPDTSNTHLEYLDSIGIYLNGTSLACGFAHQSFNLSSFFPDWYFNHHNLITINAYGTFAFSFCGKWGGGTSMTDFIIFNNTNYFLNIYEIRYVIEPYFYCFMNTTFHINSLQIEGCKLTESGNTYWLEFEYENVSISESYFYVIGNKLYFTLNIQESEQLEYIKANFNIEDFSTTNYRLSFYSNFNGDTIGNLSIDYYGGESDEVIFPNYNSHFSFILSQGKIIDNFTIFITDDNLDVSYGVTTGYVYSIKLIYIPDIEFTILTLALIQVIIPLMVIILPPLALYKKLGKNVVIPMMFLMSIICLVGGLIDTWLFFIMCIGFMAFIFAEYKHREG